MITLRPASERGHADHGWLDTHHTFSFADYYDRRHMGFRALRVINEDHVAPANGFGTHPHRDMEILTYVVSGTLAHRDSMGTGAEIKPGEVQRMTAGTGVTHSEKNPSRTEPVHLLQIWLLPERPGLTPSYEQKAFPMEQRRGRLLPVATRDGRDGTVTVHQDVALYAGLLDGADAVELPLAAGRHAWVQVVDGTLEVNGRAVGPGDGVALSDEPAVRLGKARGAHVLVFDLA